MDVQHQYVSYLAQFADKIASKIQIKDLRWILKIYGPFQEKCQCTPLTLVFMAIKTRVQSYGWGIVINICAHIQDKIGETVIPGAQYEPRAAIFPYQFCTAQQQQFVRLCISDLQQQDPGTL